MTLGKRNQYTVDTRLRIANACKRWRKEHGYYQKEIAAELHLSPNAIAQFELGRNDSATIYNWYVNHGVVVPIENGLTVRQKETMTTLLAAMTDEQLYEQYKHCMIGDCYSWGCKFTGPCNDLWFFAIKDEFYKRGLDKHAQH